MLFYARVSLLFVSFLADFKYSLMYFIVSSLESNYINIYISFVSFFVAFWFEPRNLLPHYDHNRYQTKFLTTTKSRKG